MAIKEVIMYYVQCDNCKESLFKDHDYSCYSEHDFAKDVASNILGVVLEHNGNDYCSYCANLDDEDNLIIDKTRFKEQ